MDLSEFNRPLSGLNLELPENKERIQLELRAY